MATYPHSAGGERRSRLKQPVTQPTSSTTSPVSDNATTTRPSVLRAGVIYGVGTLLLLLNAYFGTYAYVVVQALLWTQTSLQRGPIVMLSALVLVNFLVVKTAKRFALTQQELLVLYSMLCIGTCAGGFGMVQQLINQMAAPFYYASGGNGFKDRFNPFVPIWLAPQDPEVYNGFFRGNSTFYNLAIIKGWAVPVLAWGSFLFAIYWTLFCATTLVRKQWVEEERLTFPLVLLPLEMTGVDTSGAQGQASVPFWKNKLMWAGFIVAGLLESANFVHFLYPGFPGVPIKPSDGFNEISKMVTSRPYNAVGSVWLSFYPFAIGIGYLLSLDVSFSCWFLYLVGKASLVACSALGLSEGGGGGPANRAPFLREQGAGAFVGIALFSAWMARRALIHAWNEMKRPTGADRNEFMSYRMAYIGGFIGVLFMCGFLVAAGLPIALAGLFVFVYLAFAITLARIVSEAGAGWAWSPGWSPASLTGDAFGANHLTTTQLTVLYGYTGWMSDMRDNPMPQSVSAMKIGQGGEINPRAYLKPLVWATGIGILAAFWAHLEIYYTYGAATAKVRPALSGGSAYGAARTAVAMMTTPTLQDVTGMTAAFGGIVIAVGMSLLRQQLPWWPLHPLGYALATTQSMDYMWCPFFIAWLAKRITLRYGGIRAYRIALPFFLGLILGDYVVPALWGLFGMGTGYQQYMAFPH